MDSLSSVSGDEIGGGATDERPDIDLDRIRQLLKRISPGRLKVRHHDDYSVVVPVAARITGAHAEVARFASFGEPEWGPTSAECRANAELAALLPDIALALLEATEELARWRRVTPAWLRKLLKKHDDIASILASVPAKDLAVYKRPTAKKRSDR
jgi:hypothetical protein